MKWIDFYIILIVTLIARLLIRDNLLFFLSGIPTGVLLGYLRARSNYSDLMKKKDGTDV